MELLPKTPDQIQEDIIKTQISMEKSKQAERERYVVLLVDIIKKIVYRIMILILA